MASLFCKAFQESHPNRATRTRAFRGTTGVTGLGPQFGHAAGVGIAMATPATMAAALTSVSSERTGISSGIANAGRLVGGAIGVALFGSMIDAVGAGHFTRATHLILIIAGASLIGAATADD